MWLRYVIAAGPVRVFVFFPKECSKMRISIPVWGHGNLSGSVRPRPSFQSAQTINVTKAGGNQAEGAIAVDPSNPAPAVHVAIHPRART